MSAYGAITRRSSIRQFLPDELVEPFFLLAVVTGVGAHEAGYDEGHDVAWLRGVYTWSGYEKIGCGG